MAAAKDDPVSVEDKDNIEALLDDADRLSSTISRPFSGLSTVLARIRAASIAQKKELDATLEVCQQMQKKVDVAEAKTQDILNQVAANFKAHMSNIVKEAFTEAKRKAMAGHSLLEAEASAHVEEPTKVGDAVPRLASHAGYPAKRSRPSPSASSGASSGAAGGAAGGAAEGVAGQGFSDICPLTKCLVSQCLHCRPLSDM